MKRLFIALYGILLFTSCKEEESLGNLNDGQVKDEYILVFKDDFNDFDTTKWNNKYWFGYTNVGNNEDQLYINDALNVVDGLLRIEAKYDPQVYFVDSNSTTLNDGILNYTSGIITTHNKVDIQFGKVKVRCKLPSGQGVWPALWLLPTSTQWPPEIDIIETIGDGELHFSFHYWSNQHNVATKSMFVPDLYEKFHVFELEWNDSLISWYVDGELEFTVNKNIPDEPMYFIANLAIGGNWPGYPSDPSEFPKYFEIDYVEIYQLKD